MGTEPFRNCGLIDAYSLGKGALGVVRTDALQGGAD